MTPVWMRPIYSALSELSTVVISSTRPRRTVADMDSPDDVRGWIVAKVVQVAGVKTPLKSVASATLLRHDLGITSLMAVNMVLDAEEHFGIYVEDAELAILRTVGDVVDLVTAKLSRKQGAAE
jgi:acyl carrier protein